jgi:uncharacterized metal-binding protein YceD (DUF177 family)
MGQNYIELPLSALDSEGQVFEYDLDTDFFADNQDIIRGQVRARIETAKMNGAICVILDFEGELTVACDRCLEELVVPVERTYVPRVSFIDGTDGSDDSFDDDDTVFVQPDDEYLALDDYVYESVCLALPMQRVHGTDEQGKSLCNPEMLKYIAGFDSETDGTKHISSPFSILKDKI